MSQKYMYIIKKDERKDVMNSFLEKLSTQSRPGAIITMTKDEFEIAKTMISVPLGPPEPNELCPHGRAMNDYCLPCGRTNGGGEAG